MKISKKYYDFMLEDSVVDILEGTTRSGKTTTAINTKFLYKVKTSKQIIYLVWKLVLYFKGRFIIFNNPY